MPFRVRIANRVIKIVINAFKISIIMLKGIGLQRLFLHSEERGWRD